MLGGSDVELFERQNVSAYFNPSSSRAMGKDVVTGHYNFEQELDYIATHRVHLDHDQRLTASGGIGYDWHGTRLGADFLYGSGLRTDFANTSHCRASGRLTSRRAAISTLRSSAGRTSASP